MNMPRIQQLPNSVITKIAAGEVIERPASVVKELLENSVDAGSTRIDVEVEQGGVELIRVVDNGCGIVAEDLPLAFASHATSKLQSADDLFRIGTMGFRGEALASICGVAQVTLQSRATDKSAGAEITCHGGELSEVRPWNGASGTRIEVRHLFYNTPVRRKFLRTTATELGHISEMITRIALAQRGLHLVLKHNNRHVLEVPAGAALRDRLGLFFGKELREQLYELKAEGGPLRLTGYIGNPACERGNAKLQYLFLNGRCIRDRSLMHALQEGYRGLLMTGRYAVAFLFLELPPELVDVNVHPTKTEVRFRDGHAVYHLVLTAIRERLRKENLTPQLHLPPIAGVRSQESESRSQISEVENQESGNGGIRPQSPISSQWALQRSERSQTPSMPFTHQSQFDHDADRVAEIENQPSSEASSVQPTTDSGRLTTDKVMQVHDSYLVMETPEGMLVIDQHALHERILFEQLKERMRTGPLEKQRLLIPEPIELTPEQAARALEQRDALAELGLDIEDFGNGTILLTSYPALLGQRAPQTIFRAVIDHLATQDRVPTREQLLNRLLSLMACHAAVKAGDRLAPEEMAALIAQRELVGDSHHCPHGRPTTLLLSRQELDRRFRRT
jgi:DNA mismatch repair protein MutL